MQLTDKELVIDWSLTENTSWRNVDGLPTELGLDGEHVKACATIQTVGLLWTHAVVTETFGTHAGRYAHT